MSSAATLARPYARAAFMVARDGQSFADWSRWLNFSAQVALDPRVAYLIGHPKVTQAARVKLFVPDGQAQLGSPYGNFLALLAEHGRLVLLPEVLAQFEQLRAEAERTLKVRVRTAVDMDEAQLQRLQAALKARFKRDVAIEQQLDADLIGGAVIDAGDEVIDASLKGKLRRMGTVLTH
jgi:F-type H+-transporting ATPase subunit delta